ncbi:gephyrin-like molybdotransferase Glp [Flavimarina sp. Hel_I_48]|uniref:molybdopterin molybdotransferase MoeA n=1 Tax=Flavimarina sp. Hel_I_48 TaxID=1392488 RepID=UPI0004DF7DB6|nr:gephyrin-like molybdotransferase Glp [Flavimarina sp. Hel_I_48]
MIAVKEALKCIEEQTQAGKKVKIPIAEAFAHVLAEDVFTTISMPPFRQSAMDGYAIKWSDEKEYTVIGEVQAGAATDQALNPGQAVRIFTGARVPDDADTVVIQEHTSRTDEIMLIDKMPNKGSNIRPIGEQVKKGDLVLEEGTLLNEAAIGFLAGLGIDEVSVYKFPKVGILVTGNELQELGKPLQEGQIYESNAITLQMALKRAGIHQIEVKKVGDALKSTVNAIHGLLERCDFVLISGGISVGDYDFVKEALEINKVEEFFYKINQKPGKPLWYGKKDQKHVFALPGNPGSSLTCFYVYVWPALRKIKGFKDYKNKLQKAVLETPVTNTFGKVLFIKATVYEGKAHQLTGQASSMLKAFAICNALLIVPAETAQLEKGNEIEYIALDQF